MAADCHNADLKLLRRATCGGFRFNSMNRSCRRRTSRLASVVAIVFLSIFFAANPSSRASGLSIRHQLQKGCNKVASKIPTKWKKDSVTGKPRACRAIEKTIGLATRVALLGGGGGKQSQNENSGVSKWTRIEVDADSNRSALSGNLNKLSITVCNSRSPLGLLDVESLTVEGNDLNLGLSPLVTTTGVPLILLVPPVRRTVWTLSLSYYLWTVAKRLAKRGAMTKGSSATTASSIEQSMEATEVFVDGWRKRLMGGSPSNFSFEMIVSNENLENSFLLTQSSKFLLRFLMKNSVLQTAAIVGDAVNDNSIQTSIPKSPSQQKNNLLSNASGKLARINQQETPQPPLDPASESPKNKLSRLLSATAFELREAPTFRPEDGKNHLQFVSVAILPEDQGRLDFVLRTTLVAGRNRDCLLQLVQPECRFDVEEATSSLPLPKIVSGLLPKVLWLPIGPGVSIGGDGENSSNGGGLSIREITIVPEGKCKIGGDILLSPQPPSGGLVRL